MDDDSIQCSPSSVTELKPPLWRILRKHVVGFLYRLFPSLRNRRDYKEFKESGIYSFARREILKLGWNIEDHGMDSLMYHDIMDMLFTFYRQGHSGFSASYAISILESLLRYEPLAPLEGTPSEFNLTSFDELKDRSRDELGQNNRMSSVFVVLTGDKHIPVSYHLDGYVFEDEDDVSGETRYTASESRSLVLFPCPAKLLRKSTRYMKTATYERVKDQKDNNQDLPLYLEDTDEFYHLNGHIFSVFRYTGSDHRLICVPTNTDVVIRLILAPGDYVLRCDNLLLPVWKEIYEHTKAE